MSCRPGQCKERATRSGSPLGALVPRAFAFKRLRCHTLPHDRLHHPTGVTAKWVERADAAPLRAGRAEPDCPDLLLAGRPGATLTECVPGPQPGAMSTNRL